MSEETPALPEHTVTLRLLPVLLLALTIGAVGYSWHEHNVAKKLAADNSTTTASLNATRDQLNALSAKVNALEGKPESERASKPAAALYRKPLTAAVSRHRIRRVEDPRWKKMQGQLDEQGRAIESTRQDLASARTELTGSIAKTHEELVLLEKKGERNYYEFDLDKTGQFQRQGPVGLRLKKANTKHAYADLELLIDDSKVSKKHVNVYEPVVFYPADEKAPVEIVLNSVTKNHIHGYVSAPKYRSEDLQAMSNSGSNNVSGLSTDQESSDGKPSPVRQRLPVQAAPVR
jgi:hypothetical protein